MMEAPLDEYGWAHWTWTLTNFQETLLNSALQMSTLTSCLCAFVCEFRSAKGTKMGSPKSLACSSETLPEIFTMGRILVRIQREAFSFTSEEKAGQIKCRRLFTPCLYGRAYEGPGNACTVCRFILNIYQVQVVDFNHNPFPQNRNRQSDRFQYCCEQQKR